MTQDRDGGMESSERVGDGIAAEAGTGRSQPDSASGPVSGPPSRPADPGALAARRPGQARRDGRVVSIGDPVPLGSPASVARDRGPDASGAIVDPAGRVVAQLLE